ncbi:unnamed protein product [Cylicocyclus nassatus]|uniref:Uncharacterized protein n=1 Tax=Cylicocyclus nassatus TaxID=53992 RepID=A0AA36HBY0_CYLNA|nr:unnamed protein product [Cylicocyclus nassatus]
MVHSLVGKILEPLSFPESDKCLNATGKNRKDWLPECSPYEINVRLSACVSSLTSAVSIQGLSLRLSGTAFEDVFVCSATKKECFRTDLKIITPQERYPACL